MGETKLENLMRKTTRNLLKVEKTKKSFMSTGETPRVRTVRLLELLRNVFVITDLRTISLLIPKTGLLFVIRRSASVDISIMFRFMGLLILSVCVSIHIKIIIVIRKIVSSANVASLNLPGVVLVI
jgi:hypothetical protein